MAVTEEVNKHGRLTKRIIEYHGDSTDPDVFREWEKMVSMHLARLHRGLILDDRS